MDRVDLVAQVDLAGRSIAEVEVEADDVDNMEMGFCKLH